MNLVVNENGFFVVLFLPAVLAGLTLLLVKRWGSTQVSSTTSSTTAVSRRRKIIKDPLFKRPPPAPVKMMPSGSKKNNTSAATKKSQTASVIEEEANSRRSSRHRSSPTPEKDDHPLPPKHIPFPPIPPDGDLLFEAMTYMFVVVATGCQFLNLYRTVWWLPYSFTNQTMNFYLIDPHVVAFIMIILSRRLLLIVMTNILYSNLVPKHWTLVTRGSRMFILGAVLSALGMCSYNIFTDYSVIKLLYLYYPLLIYVLLFGINIYPFLELANLGNPAMHCCFQDPEAVRVEIESLRLDFNMRLKKIMFNSLMGAYYSSIIPCCFAQPYLYYDWKASAAQSTLVWGALVCRYASHLFSAYHCDILHRAALHLGVWQPYYEVIEGRVVPQWSGTRLWARGALVSVDSVQYISLGVATAAEPNNKHHQRFYLIFFNPSFFICGFLCAQMAFILIHLYLIFSTVAWHNYLSLTILLFMNYYTLFKLLRDYLVTWKVYKAEIIIKEKKSTPVS